MFLLFGHACSWPDTGAAEHMETELPKDSGADSAADSEPPPPVDADGDGYVEAADCDDADGAVHPEAAERCNLIDDDCDVTIDEDAVDAVNLWPDVDGDGQGDAAVEPTTGCPAAGLATTGEDCDDADPDTFVGADEVCDGQDQDCDGEADEDALDALTWYADGDADGFGAGSARLGCAANEGDVGVDGDCDDANPAVSPAGPEVCDDLERDEDCDGLADDADPGATGKASWYTDADGDGFGAGALLSGCEPPVPPAITATDCDDVDGAVNPAAVEVCDTIDNDCDALVDDADDSLADPSTWYADTDGDGFGDPAVSTNACTAPASYVDNADDCDDTDGAFPDHDGDCIPAIHFLALGDTGDGGTGQYAVAAGMEAVCAASGCDFVLLLGDNFYPSGVTSTSDAQWADAFETPYAGLDLQFWAVMGNHDWDHGTDTTLLDAQVDYTSVSAKWYMPADYYTRVSADTTFYGIDTQVITRGDGATQEAWLPVERAASTTTWNILFGHHPYISNGPHGNATGDLETFFDTYLCGEYDVYFAGHDHNLQWPEDTCGTAQIVSGAGHSTYPLSGTNPTFFEVQSKGFMWVEIDGRELTGVFYDDDGVELFRRTITK